MANIHGLGSSPPSGGGGNQGASQGQGGGGSGFDSSGLSEQWNNTPVITRGFIYLGAITSFLSIIPLFPYLFANCITSSIFHLQIYRPFTSFLFPSSLFTGLFSIYAFFRLGKPLETSRGSIYLLLTFLYLNILIQLSFTSVILLLSLLMPSFANACSAGFWPTLFALMVLGTFREPDRLLNLYCGSMPNKYYPWALAALFMLLMGGGLDILVGCGVGWVFGSFPEKLEISSRVLLAAEGHWLMDRPKSYGGWIALGSSGVHTNQQGYDPVWRDDPEDVQQAVVPAPAGSVFSSVSASTGHSLGGGGDGETRAHKKGSGHVLAERYEREKKNSNQDEVHVEMNTIRSHGQALRELKNLGYTEEDALQALDFSDGDVAVAIQFLKGDIDG